MDVSSHCARGRGARAVAGGPPMIRTLTCTLRRGSPCSNVQPSVSLEPLEQRMLCASDVRSITGTGNNVLHPDWGAAAATLLRLAQAAYTDGVSAPAGSTRASARAISNAIAAHPATEILSATHLAAFAYLWGQFIDHDLDLTTAASPTQAFKVQVPTGDPQFDALGTGTQLIRLN